MVFCFPLKALITHFFPRGASACSFYGDFCLWSLASDVMVLPPNQSTLKKGHILFWNGSISHLENLYFQYFPDPSEPVCRVDVLHLHPSLPPHSTTNTYFRLHTNGECSNRTPPHGASLCVSVRGWCYIVSSCTHCVTQRVFSEVLIHCRLQSGSINAQCPRPATQTAVPPLPPSIERRAGTTFLHKRKVKFWKFPFCECFTCTCCSRAFVSGGLGSVSLHSWQTTSAANWW